MSNKSSSLHRRRFLTTLGSCAAGVPIASSFLKSRVRAQGGAPVRFIALKTFHGNRRDLWIPRPAGGVEPGSADMSLGELTFGYNGATLQPLESLRDKFTVLDGLDHAVLKEIEPGFSGHERATTALTGWGNENGESGGPSVDQFMKAELGAQAGAALVLGADAESYTTKAFSFNQSGQVIGANEDPVDVYNQLFADFMPAGEGSGPDRRDVLRRAILDNSLKHASKLRSELTGYEREKLDVHMSGLEDLRARFELVQQVSCDNPSAPNRVSGEGWRSIDAKMSAHAHLLAQGFACDLTRIATLQIGGDWWAPFLDLPTQPSNGHNDFHNEITHNIWGASVDSQVVQIFTNAQRFLAEQFGKLLTALDVPDPLGEGTILDNTVIYWTNELGANGGHADDWDNMPVLIGGGGGGKIKQGRYLKLRDVDSSNWVPHNRALISCCHAMGLTDVNFFGDSRAAGMSRYQGPLNELMT